MEGKENHQDRPNNTEMHDFAGKSKPKHTKDNRNAEDNHTADPQRTTELTSCYNLSPVRKTCRRHPMTPLP